MMKYYKYHKKDSTRLGKQNEKNAKNELYSIVRADANGKKISEELSKRGIKGAEQLTYAENLQKEVKHLRFVLKDSIASDSTKRWARKRIKQISKDKVNATLAATGHPDQKQYAELAQWKSELSGYLAIVKDSCASDSARNVAKKKAKELALQQAIKNTEFKGLYEHYHQLGISPDWKILGQQVPGIDSLQGLFDSNPEELMNGAESIATTALLNDKTFADLNQKSEAINEIIAQQKKMADPEYLKNEGKTKAKEEAINGFAEHADKIQGAQAKMSRLLGKYKEYTSNGDESYGVKRTSLQGKSLKERIVLGGNFNVVSTDPISLDLSPMIGYRFNTKFYVGVGMNYRQTFGNVDSLKYNWYVTPKNTSFRTFVNYDIIKNFYAYGEWEVGSSGKQNAEENKSWNNNYFIGLGKKLLIHPKLYMTITALYNLNNEEHNQTHPQRFQMRIGFQTSDLAFRKKKIYYNPN